MGYLDNSGLATLWSRIKQLKLANPKTLTISGGASGTYDGSQDVSVSVPSKLANPSALTFTGGASGSYDGSSAVSVEIPYNNIYEAKYDSTSFENVYNAYKNGSMVIVKIDNITCYLQTASLFLVSFVGWKSNKIIACTVAKLNNAWSSTETSPIAFTNGADFTGAVTVQAPTENMNPTTKKYVDDAIAAGGGGTGAVWGGITGTLTDQTDLQTALNSKAEATALTSLEEEVSTLENNLADVAYSGSYSDLTSTPSSLPNPNALTFTGAATGTYDGSSALTVNIPSGGGGGGASIPVGTVNAYAGYSAPSGWLLCNGQSVSRTTYADLFAVIGTTYGSGDGSTTFTLPNLTDRMVVGSNDYAGSYSRGGSGGEETHTLTTTEMPSHTHTQNSHTHTQNSHTHTQYAHTHTQAAHTHTQSAHTHTDSNGGRILAYNYQTTATGISERAVAKASSGNYMALISNNASTDYYGITSTSSTTATNASTTATNNSTTATNYSTTATNNATTATNQSTGGGAAHNNMPPYLALNYIIYAGV